VTAFVVGPDADEVGDVVADLEQRGVRALAFVGEPAAERPAIIEMLEELFPDRDL